ncbi:MAG: hypothetical protein ACYTEL_25705 [Planctomycetota bacterium]
MSRKIVLVLPLVLTLALVVGISAQGKVALTDAEMSSVYGGGRNCRTYNWTGCQPVYCDRNCSAWQEWFEAGCTDPETEPNCVGLWETPCNEQQLHCGPLRSSSSGGCANTTTDCVGSYSQYTCGYATPPDKDCEMRGPEVYGCWGERLWCNET